ncbi:MAG: hypothetical protein J5614_09790 [Paludibacteraceae bacterium]|nr:hypothetical protein [Paludibacteraceae bacterium]
MKNIRMYPFKQWAHNAQLNTNTPTFYNDVVTHYSIRYGVEPSVIDTDLIIGVEFEADDTEYDIMNFMMLAMGNHSIRAIVVSDSNITPHMRSYAVDSTLSTNLEFVKEREDVYKNRSVYARLPRLNDLYLDMKRYITIQFRDRIAWNHCEQTPVEDKDILYSQDAHIEVKFDDIHRSCVVIFKNPDRLFDECEVRLHIDDDRSLFLKYFGDAFDHLSEDKLRVVEDSWMTKVQRYFVDDLNKAINYRRGKFVR